MERGSGYGSITIYVRYIGVVSFTFDIASFDLIPVFFAQPSFYTKIESLLLSFCSWKRFKKTATFVCHVIM
jgi:hypothetical protein